MRSVSRVFRGHHDAAGVAVDAVDQRRRKRVFLLGVVFAAVVEVVLHAGDQRIEVVVFVRVHDQARLLVENHDVLVLVKHADFGRGLQEVVRLRRLREEFVLQVHRQHVAGLQARGDLAALSVQLDVLFADRLVEHGLRQVRVGFGQKFVDALVSVVRHDGNLFQAAFPFLCVRPSVKKNGGRETTMPIAMAIAIAILIVFHAGRERGGVVVHENMVACVVDAGAGHDGENAADQENRQRRAAHKGEDARDVRQAERGEKRSENGVRLKVHVDDVDQPADRAGDAGKGVLVSRRVEDDRKGDGRDEGDERLHRPVEENGRRHKIGAPPAILR